MPTLKRTLLETIPPDDISKRAECGAAVLDEKILDKNFVQSAELYNQILQYHQKDVCSDDRIELHFSCVFKNDALFIAESFHAD